MKPENEHLENKKTIRVPSGHHGVGILGFWLGEKEDEL